MFLKNNEYLGHHTNKSSNPYLLRLLCVFSTLGTRSIFFYFFNQTSEILKCLTKYWGLLAGLYYLSSLQVLLQILYRKAVKCCLFHFHKSNLFRASPYTWGGDRTGARAIQWEQTPKSSSTPWTLALFETRFSFKLPKISHISVVDPCTKTKHFQSISNL